MKRKKQSIQNVVLALLSEVLVAVVGFLFPQAIIQNYGSRANGLITSLQQMMQYFTLIEAGLSGAAVFALYKPLAENDTRQIQRILCTAKKLYFKIGLVFTAIVVGVSVVYPLLIADTGYPKWVVSALFCLIGVNGASQLFFIGKYKVLLNASQNNRYVVMLNAASTCLFSLSIIAASFLRVHLLLAVAVGCGAYLVRALCYYLVVKKLFPQYRYTGGEQDYPFENQREVFIQQILSLLVMNSSVLLLSFSKTDMAQISVFTVYNMILAAVLMLTNAVHNGVSASFGDLIARNDPPKLRDAYARYEMLYQVFWTVVFACVSALFLPFIKIYTGEFTDAQYIRPELCVLFSILGAVWSVRIQQSILIVAAGKFKEIQKGSIVEAVLAIVLSGVGLYLGGLEGLMVGRVLAAVYRMVDFTRFSHRHVLDMKPWITVKGVVTSTVVIVTVYLASNWVLTGLRIDTYIKWAVYAIGVAALAGAISVPVNLLLYREQAAAVLGRIRRKRGGSGMKVGVLTFHRVSNYGTALQAYATVAALKELGFDAELIDYRPEYIERTVRVRHLRHAKGMKEAASIMVNRLIYGKQQAQKIERFLEFVEQIPRSELVPADSLARAAEQYDVIISGSDQLWNENVTGGDLAYFLPFAHPRKISLASSFGVSGLTEGRKETISPYLKDFSAISLREQTALNLVSEMLGAGGPRLYRVVDPTLLVDADGWKQQAAQVDLPPRGYILTYYMIETPVLRAVTEKLRQQTGLPIVNVKPSKRQMLRREGQNMMWAGPAEFLSCYAGAKYVVTNSFHGTAFAINFGIPMYVCPLPVSMAGEVNSRLVEILDWYGLSDRWIESADQSLSVSPLPETLPQIRQTRREESIEILKSMLAP